MADALFVVLRKVALSLGEGALEKIAKEVVEAAPLMADFEHSMKQIEGELSVLQAFINQVSAQRVSDKAFDAWLDQVRDVAHEVEDIIDEYAYLTAQVMDTNSFFKRKFRQIKNIAAWQKFPSQISQVEARIQRLSEMRGRYGFSVSELDRNNNFQLSSQFCLSDSAYLIDNSEIEDGTMMNLHALLFAGLRNLKAVPEGIKYIRTLHEMFLTDMSNEFIIRLHGSDNHIVQHIPNINNFDSSDSQAVNNAIYLPWLAKKFGSGAIKYASINCGSYAS